MKTTLKAGDVITMILDGYSSAPVVKFKSMGPVNIRYEHIVKDGDPAWWRDEVFMIERSKVGVILRGSHPEVQVSLLKSKQDYETAYREHDRVRRLAVSDLERAWDEENPRPRAPYQADILEGLGLRDKSVSF